MDLLLVCTKVYSTLIGRIIYRRNAFSKLRIPVVYYKQYFHINYRYA